MTNTPHATAFHQESIPGFIENPSAATEEELWYAILQLARVSPLAQAVVEMTRRGQVTTTERAALILAVTATRSFLELQQKVAVGLPAMPPVYLDPDTTARLIMEGWTAPGVRP